jgi:integrase
VATETKAPEKAHRKRSEGRIWQIGRMWWIQYYVRGRQVRETSHSEKHVVVERLLKRRLGEREVGILPMPKAERVRYEEMRDALYADYRVNSRKSLRRLEEGKEVVWGIQHLDAFFRCYKATDITTDRIREFIDKRQAAGASNASINRALAGLRRMFHLAVQDSKLRDIPHIPMLKEPPARKGFLKHEAYIRLRDALPDHLRPVLAVGYYTGMRLGEILPLRWEQVDLVDREIRLDPGTTKNDEPRTIPLCADLAATLSIQFRTRNRDCPFVFFQRGNGDCAPVLKSDGIRWSAPRRGE